MTSRIAQICRWRAGAALRSRLRDLTGALVVVTGGGSGIGRASAIAFAAEGAIVVVADKDLDSARETVALVNVPAPGAGGSEAVFGGAAHAYELDVSDEQQVRKFAQTVRERHGVADVLVNNAGIGVIGAFADTPQSVFQNVMDVNFWGVVYGCRAFTEQMIEAGTGGQIVNVSSAAAYMPQRNLAAYTTSKAGVFMLSECLRAELLEHGIGVTVVCPDLVDTNLTRATEYVAPNKELRAARRTRTLAMYPRLHIAPEKVAKAIVGAVRHNKPVVTVAPGAKVRKWLMRFAPRVMRVGARFDID
ncbi:SDR family NAD(P)-dependent oxidoreductase [Rhodococcus pyridinivorans]|uniref:SDR family NAD(P)-dependent oxidoreductase n=1 Tax=Rhodococcus pyridinivorans TaxID=103816 RepID=UPI0022265ED4|nr:SDR family NAD(P)-dependent oxidoreductase [Rhodococcus pyridinivorans]MCW3468813.1 SDR family NAD(P)-dependent oxidoreductase [Rhodococcus pyridinivorans]